MGGQPQADRGILGPSSLERSRVQRKEDVQIPQAMKTMEKNIMEEWMEQRRWRESRLHTRPEG
jgi:hypothetical protein